MASKKIIAISIAIIAISSIFVIGFFKQRGHVQNYETADLNGFGQQTETSLSISPQKIQTISFPTFTSSFLIGTPAHASEEDVEWKGLKNSAIRSIQIDLDESVRGPEVFEEGDILTLQLFNDVQIQARVSRSLQNVNGTISTTAHISGSQYGRFFLAQTNGEVRAKIIVPEQNKMYGIHYNSIEHKHYALELDPSLEQVDDDGPHPIAPIEANDILADESDPMLQGVLPAALNDESIEITVIDILVVYTNLAFSEVGSLENMQNLIAIGMAIANDAHTNTDTGMVLNLAHSALLDYTENLAIHDKGDFLEFITSTSDEIMDEVHAIRDTHGADFVSLIVGDGVNSGGGGIAWSLTSTSGNPSYAFSVVDESIYDGYTPAHEIGHNMGLSHAIDQSTQPGPTGGSIGTDAAGWHWHPTPGESGYCSVMSYTNGGYFGDGLGHTRIGLFSDPNIFPEGHNGLVAGDIDDGNNARVLRLLKNVYEGYRDLPLADNTILVDYPNESLSWSEGNTYSIIWNSKGISGNVKIELYQNGSLNRVIVADTFNYRSYAWTVPPDLSGENFVIRISSVDVNGIYDESDTGFAIHEAFFSELLDSEPAGFTTTSGWEFGAWTEDTSSFAGPEQPYTGANIYDTNIDGGVYSNAELISPVIDCSNYQDTHLRFAGWFSMYDGYRAKVELKIGSGGSWQELYSRDGRFDFNSWQEFDFDISSYADGEAEVYIRWYHEDVTGSSNYAGMSVDDIQVTGVYVDVPLPGDVSGNGTVGIDDAILALQILAGFDVSVNIEADVNADTQLGLSEAIYVLREAAEL